MELSGEEDFKEYVTKNGCDGINKFIETQINKWQNVPINVAVTGASGTGKSSYINAIRGLNADDEGAAEVGLTETTMVPKSYEHPENPQLQFWDLPGVGTKMFPKDSYVNLVDFNKYDFFLILCCVRFTEDDLWLAKEVQCLGKSFFFIRTKIDEELKNDQKAHPKTHSPEKLLLEKMEKDCQQQLVEGGFEIQVDKIFLISNHYPTKWKFLLLTDAILDSLPQQKKVAMAMSLSVLTENIIHEKRQYLNKHVWMAAAASATLVAPPILGLSLAADTSIIFGYLQLFKKAFGLDENSLQNLATSSGKSLVSIKGITKTASSLAKQAVGKLLAKYVTSESTEEIAKFALPIVGSVISASISFYTTYSMISDILNDLEKEAIELTQFIIKENVE